jgi:hypothetical protein
VSLEREIFGGLLRRSSASRSRATSSTTTVKKQARPMVLALSTELEV